MAVAQERWEFACFLTSAIFVRFCFFGGSRRSTFLFLKGGWGFLGFRVSSLGPFGAWVSFAQEAFLFGARELGLWDSGFCGVKGCGLTRVPGSDHS